MISGSPYPFHLSPDTNLYALDVEPHLHGTLLVTESGVIKSDHDHAITDANAVLEHCPPGTRAVLRHVARVGFDKYRTLSEARACRDRCGVTWTRWTR